MRSSSPRCWCFPAPRRPSHRLPEPDRVDAFELDAAPSKARAQLADLQRRQDAALAAVAPEVKPDAEYRTALAGFAAKLSDQQAEAMRSAPGVKRVTRERFLQLHGIAGSEAALLGLPGGLWQATGGPKDAGRGVIVGVVDSGITPESRVVRRPRAATLRRRGTARARPASVPRPRAATTS